MGFETYGDWDKIDAMLSAPRFRRAIRKHMKMANRRIGLDLVRRIRVAMRTGDYAANSALTRAIKGSSKPLIDNGDLFRSIAFHVDPDGFGLMVGANRNARTKSGEEVTSIAAALHEGFSIDLRVNPKVRAAVFAKLRKQGRQKKWTPASKGGGATVWVVPARPFIMGPVQEAWDEGVVQDRWREAFILALHDGS